MGVRVPPPAQNESGERQSDERMSSPISFFPSLSLCFFALFFIFSPLFCRLASVRILQLLIILLLFCFVLSCEGVLNSRGHVYDNATKRGIDSVQVILVLGKNDTIWKCNPSISPDNQSGLDNEKYQLAFTDTGGYFSISSGLIGMGPEDLKAKVIFTKKGYSPVIITTGDLSKLDSVQMQQLQ